MVRDESVKIFAPAVSAAPLELSSPRPLRPHATALRICLIPWSLKMKYALLIIGGLLTFAAQLASPQTASADNAFVAVRDLPEHISRAADSTVADVNWFLARRMDNGWYAIGGLTAQKKFVEFRCDGEANNRYFRIVIQRDELPVAVKTVLETNYAGATVTRIQSAGLADGKVTAYRFEASNLPDGYTCFYIGGSGQKNFMAKD
jgi:hypothetical protein